MKSKISWHWWSLRGPSQLKKDFKNVSHVNSNKDWIITIDILVIWFHREKMDANLVTTTSSFVMNSTVINSASSVASSPVILLESPLILPNAQPDILQQALEAALPISTSAPAAGVVPKLPILPVPKTKEDYVTVFDSRDGTLRLSQENARALGINISTQQGNSIFLMWLSRYF